MQQSKTFTFHFFLNMSMCGISCTRKTGRIKKKPMSELLILESLSYFDFSDFKQLWLFRLCYIYIRNEKILENFYSKLILLLEKVLLNLMIKEL
ncbi:hypothetical protein BpHYR1_035296 [Brachionus plicatilis]|uniref:Uncharacterized protein n=1 Tax=Brachionus plicatilis TaxID=10195 RepID=A0A3M7RU16_BRAPC|nr:hypothetical protein BpHYR1_035296 [Brachionus plicatilis]